jgi:hypothetical protein
MLVRYALQLGKLQNKFHILKQSLERREVLSEGRLSALLLSDSLEQPAPQILGDGFVELWPLGETDISTVMEYSPKCTV